MIQHPHDSTLWIEPNRAASWRHSELSDKESANQLLGQPVADYAEVDAVQTGSLTTFQGNKESDGSISPAPYATTTLIPKSSNRLAHVGY